MVFWSRYDNLHHHCRDHRCHLDLENSLTVMNKNTTSHFTVGDLKYNRTRFPELVYSGLGRGCWSFFNRDDDGTLHRVGPFYATKAELLSDLYRYATEFGCQG